jgi:Protein of unknown function DUF262/Protein of unknown function (DUF1524)
MADRDKSAIGFEHKSIGLALAHNRFVVPLNQREYSWEGEHVTDLFQDFAGAITGNRDAYFLGTIVLTTSEDGNPEVCDGQQRLATTTILLAAIRDYFHRNGDTIRVRSVEDQFLTTIDRDTTETVPRLTLNVDDNQFFRSYVLSAPDSTDRSIVPTKPSHKKIAEAARLAVEHVQDILRPQKEDNKVNVLLDWVRFIENGAQVILLRVPDDLDAFIMFETLNDRGLATSKADLLKNRLFKRAGNQNIKEAQTKWAQMKGTLESLGIDDITVTYLRHLLITEQGPTKEREVLDRVRRNIDSQQKALQFLDQLAISATDYVAILNPNHRKWNDYGETTRRHLRTINDHLRVEQIRPLVFAVAKHFAVKEAKKAFKLFVCWSVRFLVAGGRGGLLDRNYAIVAEQVGKHKITTAKELVKAMQDVVPTDPTFEAAFSEARVSQNFLARYYLRALEMMATNDPEPELIPNEAQEEINLEHVLPENPGAGWPDIDPEVASANYRRLGNLVLLKASSNSIIGNSAFADKRKVLKESAYLLTAEVGKKKGWGIKEIAERQKRLAALAVKTWPIDVR